jgi:hypothetical protein
MQLKLMLSCAFVQDLLLYGAAQLCADVWRNLAAEAAPDRAAD